MDNNDTDDTTAPAVGDTTRVRFSLEDAAVPTRVDTRTPGIDRVRIFSGQRGGNQHCYNVPEAEYASIMWALTQQLALNEINHNMLQELMSVLQSTQEEGSCLDRVSDSVKLFSPLDSAWRFGLYSGLIQPSTNDSNIGMLGPTALAILQSCCLDPRTKKCVLPRLEETSYLFSLSVYGFIKYMRSLMTSGLPLKLFTTTDELRNYTYCPFDVWLLVFKRLSANSLINLSKACYFFDKLVHCCAGHTHKLRAPYHAQRKKPPKPPRSEEEKNNLILNAIDLSELFGFLPASEAAIRSSDEFTQFPLSSRVLSLCLDHRKTLTAIFNIVTDPIPPEDRLKEQSSVHWLYAMLAEEGVLPNGSGTPRTPSAKFTLVPNPRTYTSTSRVGVVHSPQPVIAQESKHCSDSCLPLIHVIWIGGKLPILYCHYLMKFLELNPGASIILWTDSNQGKLEEDQLCGVKIRRWTSAFQANSEPTGIDHDEFLKLFNDSYCEFKQPVWLANHLRAWVLYQYGGAYFDFDELPLDNPMNPIPMRSCHFFADINNYSNATKESGPFQAGSCRVSVSRMFSSPKNPIGAKVLILMRDRAKEYYNLAPKDPPGNWIRSHLTGSFLLGGVAEKSPHEITQLQLSRRKDRGHQSHTPDGRDALEAKCEIIEAATKRFNNIFVYPIVDQIAKRIIELRLYRFFPDPEFTDQLVQLILAQSKFKKYEIWLDSLKHGLEDINQRDLLIYIVSKYPYLFSEKIITEIKMEIIIRDQVLKGKTAIPFAQYRKPQDKPAPPEEDTACRVVTDVSEWDSQMVSSSC